MLEHKVVKVHLKNTFRTAHGAADVKHQVIVNIEGGLGEAAPVAYYGESIDTISDFVEKAADLIGDDVFKLEDIIDRLNHFRAYNTAAKAAIDIALHDAVGTKLNIPVYKMLGITAREDIPTSYTISISDPDDMKRQTEENPGYEIYKIKVGVPGDIDMVAAVREATDARIRVDANAGWTLKEAVQKIKHLERYDIEFVEQPLHWHDYEGFRILRSKSNLPIIADEGIMDAGSIALYNDKVDGINIKLQKSGGIREGFKMIAVARALKMQIMIGCMVETSVGISAAAQLAPLVDYIDLDGNLLIDDDPYDGVRAENGYLKYPDRPGIGVVEKG
ncbi:MAG: dipeptide epimerase [candidate division Zixibacteria bacterium]|nr:dipeptide epimerase [candidate division Zixibacteria bacterium]